MKNSTRILIVSCLATRLVAAVPVTLSQAGASFAQAGFPAAKSIDQVVSANNGWAVAPRTNQSHQIWWSGSSPAAGTRRSFDFVLNFRGTTGTAIPFNIQQFSLFYTTDTVVSGTSNWLPMEPSTASTARSPGDLTINPSNGRITFSGAGSNNIDYLVEASADPGPPITGFSMKIHPVSGGVGPINNIVLTEFSVESAPVFEVPRDITISEGSGPITLQINKPTGLPGNLNLEAVVVSGQPNEDDYRLSATSFNFVGSNITLPLVIEALADGVDEGVETVTIEWPSSSLYTLTNPTTTIRIGDMNSTGFFVYMADHGLSGRSAQPHADPNEDGITNLEAYAFRLNPAGPSPAAWRERLPRFTTRQPGRGIRPAITWQLPSPLPSDIRFVVEESPDFVSWTSIARRSGYGVGSLWTGSSANVIVESGNPTRSVIVPGSKTLTAKVRSFLRLRYEHAPGDDGLG